MDAIIPEVVIKQEMIEEAEHEWPTQENFPYNPAAYFSNRYNESAESITPDLTFPASTPMFVKVKNIEGSENGDFENDSYQEDPAEVITADCDPLVTAETITADCDPLVTAETITADCDPHGTAETITADCDPHGTAETITADCDPRGTAETITADCDHVTAETITGDCIVQKTAERITVDCDFPTTDQVAKEAIETELIEVKAEPVEDVMQEMEESETDPGGEEDEEETIPGMLVECKVEANMADEEETVPGLLVECKVEATLADEEETVSGMSVECKVGTSSADEEERVPGLLVECKVGKRPSEADVHMLAGCKDEVDFNSDASSEPLEDDEMDQNLESSSTSDEIVCRFCTQKFVNFKERVSHTKEKHKRVLGGYFEDLDQYGITLEGYRPHTCKICGKFYRKKESLMNHILGHKGLCYLCCYTSSDYEDMKKHMRVHARYKCDQCEYTSSSSIWLETHKSKHLEKKMFHCDFCSYSCEGPSELKQHMASHPIKELCCNYCEFTCYDKMDLNSHMVGHIRGQKLKCGKCDKVFYYYRELKKHMNEHEREEQRLQKCSLCEFSTVSKRVLKDHMRTHPKMKSLICSLCKRGYQNVRELKKHVNQRHIRS